MEGRRFDGNRIAPVKVGAELDVKIEGVGEKGDGIAKVQGFVLFVPGGGVGWLRERFPKLRRWLE